MIKKGTGSYSIDDIVVDPDITLNIGSYTSIARDLRLFPLANHPSTDPKWVTNFPPDKMGGEYKRFFKKDFTIGSDVWIGESVTLCGGCEIGDGAIIGAFSVVRGKIPPFSVCIGNPASIIKYRFKKDIVDKLLKIKWWNWDEDMIRDRELDFHDILTFVKKYG